MFSVQDVVISQVGHPITTQKGYRNARYSSPRALDFDTSWCVANLASQPELGLCSKRRNWTYCLDHRYTAAVEAYLESLRSKCR